MDLKTALRHAGIEAHQMQLANREYLFRTGDPVQRMHLVESGVLVMLRRLTSGQELVVQRAYPGELLAEASLFAENYHCDAICDGDVTCTVYDRHKLLDALQDPGLSLSMLRIYSRTIRDLRSQFELSNIRRADDRVLAYLSLLPADDEGWREQALPWTDVARSLGLSHEAIYRALAALTKAGRLERDDSRYRLAED